MEEELAPIAMASFVVANLCTVPSALVVVGFGIVCNGDNPATDRASGFSSSFYAFLHPFAQAVSVELVEAAYVNCRNLRRQSSPEADRAFVVAWSKAMASFAVEQRNSVGRNRRNSSVVN